MVDQARARRLSVRIRQIAAETLERQVKDPRLRLVTVTGARVSGDLREATVFYTVYGGEAEAGTAPRRWSPRADWCARRWAGAPG
jgi:ribosome-binding factor A